MKVQNLLLYKISHKAGNSCAWVCILCSGRREVSWNYLVLLYELLQSKKKRKDAISVSSCNSINSAMMYNMEIMIKLSFVIALILTAIMIIVFNSFQTSL